MKKLYIYLLYLPLICLGQSPDQNYIKSVAYKVATTNSIPNPTPEQAQVQITYFDGLGRPIQQVAHKQSSQGHDIITHMEYAPNGVQQKEFLPFVRTNPSMNFDPNAKANQESFYASNSLQLTGNPHFEITQNPYSEKLIEASPLLRVFKQAAPGNAWAMGEGKEIKMDYQANEINEVVHFKATAQWSSSSGLFTIALVRVGFYDKNQLYKTLTRDENWIHGKLHTTEEFKNKQGQVVLKRTYNTVNNAVQAHDTYYVYDNYGNLTYVLPPMVETVNSTPNPTELDAMCYQYRYDSRNRLVEKKLPGKQWEFIVYDKLDRVVATGPAFYPFEDSTDNQEGWLFTKYDAFNRPVVTGWKMETVTSDARHTLQTTLNAQTSNFNEQKINTTSNTTINGVSFRYTTLSWPTSGYHVLTVNYYDNYNFPHATTYPTTIEGEAVYYNNTLKPKGLLTGSYVRVLEKPTLNNADLQVVLYDKKGRVLRNHTTNYIGGYTQVDSKLDFTGKTLYTKTRHRRLQSSDELTTTDWFTYSAQDRLLSHMHQINNLTPELLSYNQYDQLGQLLVKNVGGTDPTGANVLQRVNYKYNIRGWLKEINDVNALQQGSDPLDLFAFKIGYHEIAGPSIAGVHELYNGNIAETYWKASSDNVLRKYSYAYDDLNRLKEAVYQKPTWNNPVTNNYNESLTYDKNGNIITLQRNGALDDPIFTTQIDDLEYTYHPQIKNQLQRVRDNSASPEGFVDGNTQGDDYMYDANGNMIADANKGIERIWYNHMNLPVRILFSNSGNIYYRYNAQGVKVQKRVVQNGTTTTTDYLTGYQYVDEKLQFFPHAEGYVKQSLTRFEVPFFHYVYNYTDHLGNIRLSYTLDPQTQVLTLLEENHYYPFGLKHKNYNTTKKKFIDETELNPILIVETPNAGYQYKYNGKEWQDELGLNMYDYHARNYDPAIGRWMNIDPLAEKYANISSYVYVANNPLIYIDPDGKQLLLAGDKKNIDRTISVANNGIGKNVVKVDKNGNVSVRSLNDKQLSKLTPEQRAMYGVMKDVVDAKGTVKIGVESGSKDVLIGSYNLEKIDIADIEAFGDGKGVNQYSTLGHEVKEQQEKQLNGKGYTEAHQAGMDAEKDITGYERQPTMTPSTRIAQNADGTITGNADVIYTNDTEKVKASIHIDSNNVIKVIRTDEKK